MRKPGSAIYVPQCGQQCRSLDYYGATKREPRFNYFAKLHGAPRQRPAEGHWGGIATMALNSRTIDRRRFVRGLDPNFERTFHGAERAFHGSCFGRGAIVVSPSCELDEDAPALRAPRLKGGGVFSEPFPQC